MSKAQRAQNNLEKIDIFETFLSFKKSRIVPKNVERDPSIFINIHSLAKYQKTQWGHFGDIENFRKKVAQCRKKYKGDLQARPDL